MRKGYFIVTSHGWSASHWLAVALDTHPEILCFHSALHIHSRGGDSSEEFLRKNVGLHGNAVESRENLSLDAAFSEIEDYCGDPKKRIFGNVHTFRLRDLPAIHDKYPNPRRHMVMNLVRHPVSVVQSGFGQLHTFLDWDIFVMIDVVNSVKDILEPSLEVAKRHNLNLCSHEVMAFIAACFHQYHLARDQHAAPEAPTIIMERVTTEPDYFAEIVRLLTYGEIESSDEYLKEVFNIGQRNRHSKSKKMDARTQYESWEPWQKEIFAVCMRNYEIDRLYEKFGYDFSFVSN